MGMISSSEKDISTEPYIPINTAKRYTGGPRPPKDLFASLTPRTFGAFLLEVIHARQKPDPALFCALPGADHISTHRFQSKISPFFGL